LTGGSHQANAPVVNELRPLRFCCQLASEVLRDCSTAQQLHFNDTFEKARDPDSASATFSLALPGHPKAPKHDFLSRDVK
jgi:hypothetical protein